MNNNECFLVTIWTFIFHQWNIYDKTLLELKNLKNIKFLFSVIFNNLAKKKKNPKFDEIIVKEKFQSFVNLVKKKFFNVSNEIFQSIEFFKYFRRKVFLFFHLYVKKNKLRTVKRFQYKISTIFHRVLVNSCSSLWMEFYHIQIDTPNNFETHLQILKSIVFEKMNQSSLVNHNNRLRIIIVIIIQRKWNAW